MDILAMLTGNRVHYGINMIGGVKRDLSKEQIEETLKAVDILEERTKYYIEVATQETTLIGRLAGVGRLSAERVVQFGATGPTARAAGIRKDVRKDDPYAAYAEVDFNVITDDHADVLGRTIVRVRELMESYGIIRQILGKLPEGPISVRAPRKIPEGEAISRYEAPRGEDIHYIKGNGSEKPERVKVRAPTLANWPAMSFMLDGGYLADVPIVIAAIDPCFSCTDRMIAVNDTGSGKSSLMKWEDLRRYSLDWYKKNRGIDMGKIKAFREGR
jgi:membrane-bound hydrogenase subunit alpha